MSNLVSPIKMMRDGLKLLRSPSNLSCSDWAEDAFKLPSESSNISGPWITAPVQLAMLNCIGSDLIEKVDIIKPTRMGGTKMLLIGNAYYVTHKMRNTVFFQPTEALSEKFVKTEVEPAIRDSKKWQMALLNFNQKDNGSMRKDTTNTLKLKNFKGCVAHFLGAHSANNFRMMTADVVFLDELDGMNADVEGEGSPTTLSWQRIKNATFKKQVQISTPTIAGMSLIEQSVKEAEALLFFQIKCPLCGAFEPLEWGDKDTLHGFKWEGRDANSVHYRCKACSGAWYNAQLMDASRDGYWKSDNGWETKDGLNWRHNGEVSMPPRHVAFSIWTAYSPFSLWSEIVQSWYDAQGNINKIKTFYNVTLGQVWENTYEGSELTRIVNDLPTVQDISDIVAVTAGIDVQKERIEVQYVGHDRTGGITVLGYDWIEADPHTGEIYDFNTLAPYIEMKNRIVAARFDIGRGKIKVEKACMDTQGIHTTPVHLFLREFRKLGIFEGTNGTASNSYSVAEVPSSNAKVPGSKFWSIGVNLLKHKVYGAIRRHGEETGYFRIWEGAELRADYAEQLTAEKIEAKRDTSGNTVYVFTNLKKRRNEALDTMVMALAARVLLKRDPRSRSAKLLPETL